MARLISSRVGYIVLSATGPVESDPVKGSAAVAGASDALVDVDFESAESGSIKDSEPTAGPDWAAIPGIRSVESDSV